MALYKGDKEPVPVGRIVEEYRPRLSSFIRKRVKNRDDAEDILQDVLYQFVRVLDDNARQIEKLSSWMFRVAHNMIVNFGKKKREYDLPGFDGSFDGLDGLTGTLSGDDSNSPETSYLRSLVWEELEDALQELPLEQREVFELMEFDGMPAKDIARATGVPVNTIISRKYYAVRHLRSRLQDLIRIY